MGVCPRCGKNIIESERNFYCESGKDGCGFAVWKKDKFIEDTITADHLKNLLSGKNVKLRAKSKEGKIYSSEYVFEDTGKYVNLKRFKAEKISFGKCPKCGGDVFESDKNFYCSNKCGFAIWKEDKFNKISITAANVKDVLEGKPFCKIKKQVGGNPLKVKYVMSMNGKYVNFREEKNYG